MFRIMEAKKTGRPRGKSRLSAKEEAEGENWEWMGP